MNKFLVIPKEELYNITLENILKNINEKLIETAKTGYNYYHYNYDENNQLDKDVYEYLKNNTSYSVSVGKHLVDGELEDYELTMLTISW